MHRVTLPRVYGFAYVSVYVYLYIWYKREPAWQCINMSVFLVQSPEQFCAALCLAVACFKLRSKFNKPALTYASILYKLSSGWPCTLTHLLLLHVCVPVGEK
ncbi:hypothetical protein GOODEAATRI_031408 [Goodea atripinnis]|uniref:Uncharacterized protein n=1 Tax=Goodea atripinnis TaxID=208336 RepID=A0ABV0MWP6_9TELE